jgi:hypothetical protein
MGVKKVACLNQEVGNTALDERAKGLAEGFGGKVDVVAVPQDFTECRKAGKTKVVFGLTDSDRCNPLFCLWFAGAR